MRAAAPAYVFRSPGPVLKIAPAGNRYWRLFVGSLGGDFFEDERDAAASAAEKLSGFAEWDETAFTCPANVDDWERI